MNTAHSLPKRQQGYSLIEVIFAIGIGLAITAAVWEAYSDQRVVSRTTNQGKTVVDLFEQLNWVYSNNISFQTQPLFDPLIAGQSNPPPGTSANALVSQPASMDQLVAANNGALPEGIQLNNGEYQNIWGGTWDVDVGSTDGGLTNDLLAVSINGVPGTECSLLIQQLAPSMYDTTVNNTLVGLTPARTNIDPGRQTVDFEQAFPLCNDDEPNTIVFRRLKEIQLSDLRRIKPLTGTLTNEERGETTANRHHRISYLSQFNRVQNALNARETAQINLIRTGEGRGGGQ